MPQPNHLYPAGILRRRDQSGDLLCADTDGLAPEGVWRAMRTAAKEQVAGANVLFIRIVASEKFAALVGTWLYRKPRKRSTTIKSF